MPPNPLAIAWSQFNYFYLRSKHFGFLNKNLDKHCCSFMLMIFFDFSIIQNYYRGTPGNRLCENPLHTLITF